MAYRRCLYGRYYGLSTEKSDVPSPRIRPGSLYYETDTGNLFMWVLDDYGVGSWDGPITSV